MQLNERSNARINEKDVALIAAIFGNYKELLKDFISTEQSKRMDYLVNKICDEIYNVNEDKPIKRDETRN